MTYQTVSTAAEARAAMADYRRNVGRSPFAAGAHDAYMDRLAERIGRACGRLGEAVEIRIG